MRCHGLHDILHAAQAGGHFAALMIVDTHRVGDVGNRLIDNASDFLTAHRRRQRIFFQRLFADRLHWQMDQDLATLLVGFFHHLMRVWRIGENGNRYIDWHFQHLIFVLRLITKIIKQNSQFGCLNIQSECQRRA